MILYPVDVDGCDLDENVFIVSKIRYKHNEKRIGNFSNLLPRTFIKWTFVIRGVGESYKQMFPSNSVTPTTLLFKHNATSTSAPHSKLAEGTRVVEHVNIYGNQTYERAYSTSDLFCKLRSETFVLFVSEIMLHAKWTYQSASHHQTCHNYLRVPHSKQAENQTSRVLGYKCTT
jgi:hypothetical protein